MVKGPIGSEHDAFTWHGLDNLTHRIKAEGREFKDGIWILGRERQGLAMLPRAAVAKNYGGGWVVCDTTFVSVHLTSSLCRLRFDSRWTTVKQGWKPESGRFSTQAHHRGVVRGEELRVRVKFETESSLISVLTEHVDGAVSFWMNRAEATQARIGFGFSQEGWAVLCSDLEIDWK